MDLRIGKNFRVGTKIGSGSFGEIYSGSNVITGIIH
jgi:casein kinase I family protein HRR25